MRFSKVCLLVAALGLADAVAAQTPAPFRIWSDDVKGGAFGAAQILNSFGCTGGNVSPHLAWSGAPAGTRSFVITVYDPDAPTGSGFWHWVVANVPATATSLPNGASKTAKLPEGALETRTDFGPGGYGGPCPPAGDKPHRYIFTIHALKVDKLEVTADSSAALVGFMTNSARLGQARFEARYGR